MEEIESKILELLRKLCDAYGISGTDAVEDTLMSIPDERKVAIFAQCMQECDLKFMTYIVDGSE